VNYSWVRKTLLGLLKRIPFSVGGMQVNRYAALVETAINKYQSQVFEKLNSNYSADARFVVLTMNFDYMSGETAAGQYNSYDTQLHEVLDVKRMFPEKLLPFLFIDPRRCKECMDQLHHYFDPKIREVWPESRSIRPWVLSIHPAMKDVYAFAVDHELPIITQ
jgi:hypothetical protein